MGSRVTVGGVVIAQSGRLGTPALIAIQDSTAGIVVRLGDTTPRPVVGTWLEVTGVLADPYGQLEVRGLSSVRATGPAALPAPLGIDGAGLGEAVEGRLVTVEGVAEARPAKATSGDLSFVVTTGHGSVRIAVDASAGIAATAVSAGDRLRLTGVAGQRASRKGAADGYRIWLRGPADVARLGGSSPSPGPSSSPSPTARPSESTIRTIAAAILAGSGQVTIEGSITTSAALLDATKRRVIVQDRTAAIEVLLPSGTTAPSIGATVRVSGEVGRAYGAPRIKATTIRRDGTNLVTPIELRVAPGAAHEWRLVRVRGDVLEVHKSGNRWTAELLIGGARIPIAGLAGAGIPVAALTEGRTATIVGIVRRPYPSATDRRFAIVPRSPRDLTIGGPAGDPASASGSGGSGSTGPGASASPGEGGGAGEGTAPPDLDLANLAAHVGQMVRVGGLVQALEGDGFRLDDGTAVVPIRLRAEATDLAGSIVVGDALNATGRVERDPADGTVFVAVDDPQGIALVGGLGPEDPGSSATAAESGDPSAPAGGDATAVLGGGAPPLTAGLTGFGAPEIGAVGLILLGLASLAVTLLRRQRMRRRLAARIADRLASLAGGMSGAVAGPGLPALATAAPGASATPLGAAPGGAGAALGDLPAARRTDRSTALAADDRP